MEIFYIKKDEFLKKYDKEFLAQYKDNREFKSEKRFFEYTTGRYLVKTAAKLFYGLSDTEIIIKNDKPEFKTGGIEFNITHSFEYIMAAFSENEVGLDLEKMRKRKFELFEDRYERKFNSSEEFYKFWTLYEAEIKLQKKALWHFSTIFKNEYMLSVAALQKEPVTIKDFLKIEPRRN